MYKQFIQFINSEKLVEGSGTILTGISGGVDSMVMMDLFLRSGYSIAVAHCNFRLRGDESDKDQFFIDEHCRKHNIPFHVKQFETATYAKERGISLQMAARDLRYSWFDKLLYENHYSAVAIAHNKNDLAETFLINLARGTGIRGLTGIKAKAGQIIRPLLYAERGQILRYAGEKEILFREDSSNREVKYNRNRIRHNIIPEFEKISASFIRSIYETAGRLNEVETIYSEIINMKFDQLCVEAGQEFRISVKKLIALEPLPSYLFEFLRRWNFTREMIPDIISSLNAISGKQFYSPTHRLVKDRDHVIVSPLQSDLIRRYYIEEGVREIFHPLMLRISKINYTSDFRIPTGKNIACLDLGLLHFPLIMRKWQKGDYFQPLGLGGLKKLSDFFIDNKFSLIEKEKTWLLASGNRLAWIMGHRIDDRFKITERTREMLMIEIAD